MRVLVLSYEYPPVGGGGGRVAARVNAELVSRGHEVTVLTSRVADLAQSEWVNGVLIRRVRCARRRRDGCTMPEMVAYVIASAIPAVKLVRRWKPDVIHVHFAVPSGAVAWLASVFSKVPYLLTVHLGDVPGGVPEQTDRVFRFLKPFTLPIWRRAAGLTAVSPYVARLSNTAYGVTPEIIYNGVDLDAISQRSGGPSKPVRLLWVGRMQRQKNLPAGIDYLRRLDDTEWSLDIVGDGPDRAAAVAAVESAGLGHRVEFHGWLDEERVDELMSAADILYLPSLSEGFPVAAVRAAAHGLAIVGSRIGGLEEIVEDGVNGSLCSLQDPESFAQTLRRLITDPAELSRLQSESRRVADRFSQQRSVDAYEAALGRAGATARSWVSPRVIRANRGDLLSRWAILSSLAGNEVERKTGATFALGKIGCQQTRHLPPALETRAIPYGPLHNLLPTREGWKALRRARGVLWTAGLDLQDDSSKAKLLHQLATFLMYRLMGLRIVALMQGAGPLTTRSGKWLARRVLKRVDGFVARDAGTRRLLSSLGYRGRMWLGHDGIFLDGLPGRRATDEEIRAIGAISRPQSDGSTFDHRPTIAVNLRMWFHFSHGWMPYQLRKASYRQRSAEKMELLLAGFETAVGALRRQSEARIVLVSMYEPDIEPWEDDLPWLLDLKTRFPDDDDVVVLEEALDVPAFYSLIQEMNLVLGMRLHSTLTAVRAGVPAVHVAYTLKGADIFQALSLERYVVGLDQFMADPMSTVSLIQEALADPHLPGRIAAATEEAIKRNRKVLGDCAKTMLGRHA